MEVKDKTRSKWNAIALACMAAIIVGMTTATSFAATGHGPAAAAADLPAKAAGNSSFERTTGATGKYAKTEIEVSNYGGKTWRAVADPVRMIRAVIG
jgi:hypothetical protein